MKNISIVVASLLLTSGAVEGFVAPRSSHAGVSYLQAKAKGFGANETPTSKPKAANVASPESNAPPAAAPIDNPFAPSATSSSENDYSYGKAALERMRREKAEERNAELRKIKELKATDAMLQESSEGAVIPEKVAQRMGSRMLPFVGIPLFGSMGAFVGFWYMATYRDLEFKPALVAASTIACLVVGLVGITYSIMSTSWDPDREGSLLGGDEFSKNVGSIKAGLSRSRENAVLRDKMYDYSPEEIANVDAVAEAASKRNKDGKRKQSFGDKIGDGME